MKAKEEKVAAAEDAPKPSKPRTRRRNSCVVRKDENNLAVAEFLTGGAPLMSDRDLDATNKAAAAAEGAEQGQTAVTAA